MYPDILSKFQAECSPINRVNSFNCGVDKEFVMKTKAKLGSKTIDRRSLDKNEDYVLREFQSP